jgi:hypothetical protein
VLPRCLGSSLGKKKRVRDVMARDNVSLGSVRALCVVMSGVSVRGGTTWVVCVSGWTARTRGCGAGMCGRGVCGCTCGPGREDTESRLESPRGAAERRGRKGMRGSRVSFIVFELVEVWRVRV